MRDTLLNDVNAFIEKQHLAHPKQVKSIEVNYEILPNSFGDGYELVPHVKITYDFETI